jgi:hypothetical protein
MSRVLVSCGLYFVGAPQDLCSSLELISGDSETAKPMLAADRVIEIICQPNLHEYKTNSFLGSVHTGQRLRGYQIPQIILQQTKKLTNSRTLEGN